MTPPDPCEPYLELRQLQKHVSDWFELWKVPDSDTPIRVEFSQRMTRSLGSAYPDRNLIRLAARLTQTDIEFLNEVLCHEAAHLAAYRLHGRAIKPHGAEWRRLVAMAGYQPSARFRIDSVPADIRAPVVRRARRKSKPSRRDPVNEAVRTVRQVVRRLIGSAARIA